MEKAISLNLWYSALIEDCHAIITEAVFTSRFALVEGYHQLGERVRRDLDFKEYSKGTKTSVQDLAQNLNMSGRTLYYALQFYDKYPSLDSVPLGKNISWNKLITKYLPAPNESKGECDHDFQLIGIEVCSVCGLKRKAEK